MNDPSSHGRSSAPSAASDPARPAPTVSMPPAGLAVGGRASPEGSPRDEPATFISSPGAAPQRAAADATPGPEAWRFLPGDRLGDYELIDFVGGGGMGRVYRARDARLARVVALKVLAPDQAADEATLLRFQNEAQSAARLDHQNIARVYHVGEERGIPYIAFEFVEGLNIRELVIKKGPFTLAEALGYILQITEGLAHAADRNVVHRDIKPSNVIVTPDGVAKLIDLGLARLHSVDGGAGDLTATGVTLGTFDYISPEQARDPRTADARSDIYSLGCTFFFMFTGRPPFPEGTMLQKLLQHQGDQPPDVLQTRPDLPDEVARILRKMLAKDPRHRYQHPAELLEELLALAEHVGLRPAGVSGRAGSEPAPAPFWERHLPWVAPVLVLAIIVLVLDFFSSRRDDDRPPLELTAAPAAAVAPDGGDKTSPAQATPPAAGTLSSETAVKLEPEALQNRVPAASSTSSSAPATPTAAPVAPVPAGERIVGEARPGETTYATLREACAAAVSGDVIVLRYNGRRESPPLALDKLPLTIRAAAGHRPVVAFRPPASDDAERTTSMVRIAGGRLTLSGVACELDLSSNVSNAELALFELVGGDEIRLEGCWLTIRGAWPAADERAAGAAAFRVLPPPLRDGASAPDAPVAIELVDSVVRGEGSLLRTSGLQALRVEWLNGLLAVSQRLLVADGGADAPRAGDSRQIVLRHVTASTRRGLLRMNATPAAPQQLPTSFLVSDSILVGEPGAPLVEQTGPDAVACRGWLKWNGDRVFYQGWDPFWSIVTVDGKGNESHSYEAWLAHWGPAQECQSERNQTQWSRLPDANRPPHAHTAVDYALQSDPTANPARGAARDGDDVGCKVGQLPPPPPEPPADAPPGAQLSGLTEPQEPR